MAGQVGGPAPAQHSLPELQVLVVETFLADQVEEVFGSY